jgi:hypothetical protein
MFDNSVTRNQTTMSNNQFNYDYLNKPTSMPTNMPTYIPYKSTSACDNCKNKNMYEKKEEEKEKEESGSKNNSSMMIVIIIIILLILAFIFLVPKKSANKVGGSIFLTDTISSA